MCSTAWHKGNPKFLSPVSLGVHWRKELSKPAWNSQEGPADGTSAGLRQDIPGTRWPGFKSQRCSLLLNDLGKVFSLSAPQFSFASIVAQMVKNLSAMWGAQVRELAWKDPLEKGMATHSSILA